MTKLNLITVPVNFPPSLDWLRSHNSPVGEMEPAWNYVDMTPDGLIASRQSYDPMLPGTDLYMPPAIPTKEDWYDDAADAVTRSAYALVADLWQAVLTQKKDMKPKPLYLLWDHEIPLVNPMTSLMWLLTCEAWPMPNFRIQNGENHISLANMFPPQPMQLPTSQSFTDSSHDAIGYAETFKPSTVVMRGLGGALNASAHKGDREKMPFHEWQATLYRPEYSTATFAEGFLPKRRESSFDYYRGLPKWSNRPLMQFDAGYAKELYYDSSFHLDLLNILRRRMMKYLYTLPGMPQSFDSLFRSKSSQLRGWSLSSFGVQTEDVLRWTQSSEAIAIADVTRFISIPHLAPKVWFGWSELPTASMRAAVSQKAPEPARKSAIEAWVESYLKHRPIALKMLFTPRLVDWDSLMNHHLVQRSNALTKAGRVQGKTASIVASGLSAFAQFMPGAKSTDSKE